jgi:hypothetical protein
MRCSSLLLVWIPAALFGACGFDPEGGSTDAGIIDGPVDAAPDSDGDGRPDASDNCAMVSNSDQADEDSDSIGDVCDNCPHVADVTQANADGDGVGDACDPNPSGPNHIAAFYGFNGSAVPPEWGPVAVWTVSGGSLRQPNTEVGNRILALNGQNLTDVVLDTSLDVGSISNDLSFSSERALSVLTRYAPGTVFGTGYLCNATQSLLDANNATQMSTRFQNDGSVSGGDADTMPARLATGQNIRVIASSTGDLQACQTSTPSTVSSSFQNNQHSSGTVALRTFGIAVSFRYVVLIAPGP